MVRHILLDQLSGRYLVASHVDTIESRVLQEEIPEILEVVRDERKLGLQVLVIADADEKGDAVAERESIAMGQDDSEEPLQHGEERGKRRRVVRGSPELDAVFEADVSKPIGVSLGGAGEYDRAQDGE
jgi:hypothetical protein